MNFTFSDWLAIIGIVVAIIGIIVGAIGSVSLRITIKNRAKNINGSLQQAQVINNGLDSHAVIRLSRETTQQEQSMLVEKFENVINEFNNQPKIFSGPEPPETAKDGDLWIQTEDKIL